MSSTPASPRPLSVYISGQIFAKSKRVTTQAGTTFFQTLLVTPAADAYSSPGTINVRSAHPLGNPGDHYEGHGMLSGYRRTIPSRTDPTTGEMRPALVVAEMHVTIE